MTLRVVCDQLISQHVHRTVICADLHLLPGDQDHIAITVSHPPMNGVLVDALSAVQQPSVSPKNSSIREFEKPCSLDNTCWTKADTLELSSGKTMPEFL